MQTPLGICRATDNNSSPLPYRIDVMLVPFSGMMTLNFTKVDQSNVQVIVNNNVASMQIVMSVTNSVHCIDTGPELREHLHFLISRLQSIHPSVLFCLVYSC